MRTFYLADGFDDACIQPSSLTGYIVKDEVAVAQIEADKQAIQKATVQEATSPSSVTTTGYSPL